MQTIGKRYQGPLYNYTDTCDYCGTPWHRTEMRLDAEGKLRCPQCMDGLTPLELDRIGQAEVGYVEPVRGKTREGP
jgi:hypothetical protein